MTFEIKLDSAANDDAGRNLNLWFSVPVPVGESRVEPMSDNAQSRRMPSAQPKFSTLKILLADDARGNREVVATILRDLGCQVETVEDGVQAVEAVQRVAFDLVLMDIHMPSMDGLTAVTAIRALGGAFEHLPIVALTADVQPEHVRRCLDGGMDGHVGKPIDFAQLTRLLTARLDPDRWTAWRDRASRAGLERRIKA